MKYTDAQRLAAAQWFFDIHDAEEPSPELLQEWLRWLDADEGHRCAFDAVESAYRQIQAAQGTMAGAKQLVPYDGGTSVIAWREVAIHRQRTARRAAIAAGFAVALIGAATWVYEGMPSLWPPASGEYASRTGEHLSLRLADGSHVDLGARSRLEVGFSPQSRDVRLLGGEAFFSVHKDPARPFRVHVLEGIVTAVGTAFNVRATQDRVTVAVSEGVVSVADAGDAGTTATTPVPEPPRARLRLAAGDQLSFTERPRNAELTRVDPTQSARWRQGWLVYRDEPLRYVIADVERYTTHEIAVADTVSDALRFTGAVSKDSVTEWVEALPGVFPVKVRRQGTRLELSAPSELTGAEER
jgi:transmembrane sensor